MKRTERKVPGCVDLQRDGAPNAKENGQIVETPVEARAGFLDRPVLIVLILSTAAVIAGFIAVYTGHFGAR
jgi:hypothetical protein